MIYARANSVYSERMSIHKCKKVRPLMVPPRGELWVSTISIKETQRRQYESHNTPNGHHRPMSLGQYNGQGVYCGLSTASEMFLFFYFLLLLLNCTHFTTNDLPYKASHKLGALKTGISET